MTINHKAPVYNQKCISVSAGVDQVWSTLIDVNNWPRWNPDIHAARINGEFKVGTSIVSRVKKFLLRAWVQNVREKRSMVLSGEVMGLRIVQRWEIQELEGRTLINTEESVDGPLAHLAKKSVKRSQAQLLDHWLNNLAETLQKEQN